MIKQAQGSLEQAADAEKTMANAMVARGEAAKTVQAAEEAAADASEAKADALNLAARAKDAAADFADEEAGSAEDLAAAQEEAAEADGELKDAAANAAEAQAASGEAISTDAAKAEEEATEEATKAAEKEREEADKAAKNASRESTEGEIMEPEPEEIKETRALSEQDTSLRQGHQVKKTEIYEVEAMLIVKDTVGIDDIYSEIRAIEGVTVVSTDVKKVSVGASREKSIIKVKFMKGRRSLQYYISLLIRTVMRVNGVVNVKMASTKKIEL